MRNATKILVVAATLLAVPLAAQVQIGTGVKIGTAGSGTVNTGTIGQIAYYATNGTVVSGSVALPNGITATTQSQADGSTKVATTAYVDTGLGGKQASGTYVATVSVATANGVSGTSSGGTTPTLTIALGAIAPTTIGTATNCSSSASPAVCGSAAAGSAALPTNAVSSSIVVNTTAVTANSQIFVMTDDTMGTKLGVTCNSTVATLVGGLTVSARTAGTSFTVSNNVAVVTNPLCISYVIFN